MNNNSTALDASDIANLVEIKVKELVSSEIDWMAKVILGDLEDYIDHKQTDAAPVVLIPTTELKKWLAEYRARHGFVEKQD